MSDERDVVLYGGPYDGHVQPVGNDTDVLHLDPKVGQGPALVYRRIADVDRHGRQLFLFEALR
jgi:hypothetical protein